MHLSIDLLTGEVQTPDVSLSGTAPARSSLIYARASRIIRDVRRVAKAGASSRPKKKR